MNIKEKMNVIKEEVLEYFAPINRDFEFDANLENHPLGEQNVYRLHYVNYHRFGEEYGMGPNNTGTIDFSFKPFLPPKGMNREDAFKVLSYLTDYLERELNLKSCSERSVRALDQAIDLDRLGFTRLNILVGKNETDIIDLFTVTGRILLFKKSKYYEKYFEWYEEGVTLDEVKEIYGKLEIDFYDLEFKKDSAYKVKTIV